MIAFVAPAICSPASRTVGQHAYDALAGEPGAVSRCASSASIVDAGCSRLLQEPRLLSGMVLFVGLVAPISFALHAVLRTELSCREECW